MNAETVNDVRVHVAKAVRDEGCLELIWSVAPMENKDKHFCTGVIRDGDPEVIGTCGDSYQMQEVGTVDITAYMKRGDGDFELRSKVDKVKYFLRNSVAGIVEFDDILQDVPLEAEQTQYAIFLQVAYRLYTTELINK